MTNMRVSPYVIFGGQARGALDFYATVLGGSVDAHATRLDLDGGTIVAHRRTSEVPGEQWGESAVSSTSSASTGSLASIRRSDADACRCLIQQTVFSPQRSLVVVPVIVRRSECDRLPHAGRRALGNGPCLA